MLLGSIARTFPLPRIREGVLGVALFIGIVAFGGISACNEGGDGDPPISSGTLGPTAPTPGPTAPAAAVQEIYAMIEAEPTDQNFTDGKIYTVSVTVGGNPRTVTYQFDFSEDGVNQVSGEAMTPQTLTIL